MSDEYDYARKYGLSPKDLNKLGLEGWELVESDGNNFLFRKPRGRFIFDGLTPNERRFIEKAYKI